MKTTPTSKVLAPYGAVQFLRLATKVGVAPKGVTSVPALQRRVVRLKTTA
jgi:hypothetical protein